MYKVINDHGRNWKQSINNYYLPMAISIGCPHCNVMPVAFSLKGSWAESNASGYIVASFQCPVCNMLIKLFGFNYINKEDKTAKENIILFMYPIPPVIAKYPDELTEISPLGREIYIQSEQAELNNLYHLAGMGYRKVLEFVIKDYLIEFKKKERDKVLNLWLKECIDMLGEPDLKSLANCTAWIGNDETHYIREWEDKDLESLKRLLNAVLAKLDSNIKLKKEVENMEIQNQQKKLSKTNS